MGSSRGLYELAATPRAPDALLHVGADHTCYVGTLDYVAPHHHATVVFLAGLYGTFRVRVEAGAWLTCRTALIPAGVRHELDLHGDPLGVYYPEPTIALAPALLSLLDNRDERDGLLLGGGGHTAPMREIYEHRSSHTWVSAAVSELTRHAVRRARPRSLDPRIAQIIARLHASPDDMTPVEAVARVHGLSASRFLHLFSAQLGVPYRRYRMWNRVRAAMRAGIAGQSLTHAAATAGFADSAHFTHNFRDTFGVTPSYVFDRIARMG
jgi:AraC-like DNA-binding protein